MFYGQSGKFIIKTLINLAIIRHIIFIYAKSMQNQMILFFNQNSTCYNINTEKIYPKLGTLCYKYCEKEFTSLRTLPNEKATTP